MLPVAIYTPGWRETKWNKGSCPRNQSFSCEPLAHLSLHFPIAILSHYLTLKSDQCEISPYYINALENREVMRIEYMIREDVYIIDNLTNSLHYLYWKSLGTVNENPNFDIRVKRIKKVRGSGGGIFSGKGPVWSFSRVSGLLILGSVPEDGCFNVLWK